MAERFLDLAPQERADILNTQADRLGRVSFVLEKDIWVCWVLDRLFSMPGRLKMAFKGGTSLSKVYQVIDRFSEDVDVTLDYRDLQAHFKDKGFDEAFDPLNGGVSRSQIDKFMAALKDGLRTHVHGIVVPYFQAELNRDFGLGPESVEVDATGENVRIHYPSVHTAGHGYLKKSVLIEFGGRNLTEPHEAQTVHAYAAEGLPTLAFPEAKVTVLSPSRTFWEKATLIHAECGRESLERSVDRLSRHWYDLALLADHAIGARAMGEDRGLLEAVVAHKRVFYKARHADYDACLCSHLRLIPKGALLKGLRADYEGMQDRIFGKALVFEAVIERLRIMEGQINHFAIRRL